MADESPQPKNGTSRRVRSILWRGLRAAVITVVLVSLLAVALVIALDLGWQRDRIVSLAVALAEEQLGVPVSIEAAPGRLSREIDVRDLSIGAADDPLLHLDRLRVRWDAFGFLDMSRGLGGRDSEWIVDLIRIEGWTLRLRRTAEGRWVDLEEILARLAMDDATMDDESVEETPDSKSPALRVRRIELGEGRIEGTLERSGKSVTARAPGEDAGPLRAVLGAKGRIRELRSSTARPLRVEEARFSARLIETDSGNPDLDEAVEGELDLHILGDRIESLVAGLRAPDLEAEARAEGDFDRLDSLVVSVDARDLAPLTDWVQASAPWTGQLTGRADLSGPIEALTGRVHLEVRDLVADEVRVRELDLDLELDVSVAVAMADPMALNGALRVRGRGIDPGGLDRGWLPAGRADLDLEGRIEAGALDLRRGDLRLAGLTLEASGRATRERIEDLDLRFEWVDVEPWVRALRSEPVITGPLRGEARLHGPITRPLGRVVLQSEGLRFEDRALGALDASLRRAAGEPAALELTLGPPSASPLHVEARIDVERERIELEASGDLETGLALLDEAPDIRGRFEVDGFVERTAQGPRFALTLRSLDTFVDAHPIGRVEVEAARTSSERLELARLEIEGESGMLSLERPVTIRLDPAGRWSVEEPGLRIVLLAPESPDPGRLELRASGTDLRPTSLAVSLEAVPAAWVNRFASEGLAELGGRLSGEASWQQTRSPGWTRGRFEWTDPVLGDVALHPVDLGWSATPTRIDLDLAMKVDSRAPLEITGGLDLPQAEAPLSEILTLDRLTLEAELDDWDLAILNALSPRQVRRIAGRLSGHVRLDPSDAGPGLSGRARIEAGGFTVPILRQRFSPIEGEIRLDERVLAVDALRVGEPGADATLAATLRFLESGSPTLDGRIDFDRLPLSRSSTARMDLLGQVEVSGSIERPVVRGALSVADARIGVPAAGDPVLKEIRIATRTSNGSLVEPEGEQRDLFDEADLDVELRIPDSTRVLGQGANLFVEGEARLVKRPSGRARLQGEARVVNGTYTFQGRRFRVRRGRVLFTGDARLDPVLDIEARLPVSDIVAIIEVSGRLSSPIVRLSSEPSLSDQDVLAYLLFGRPADDVGVAGSSNFGAAAARLAAGVAEKELREVLGDAMPVDSIEIGADAEGNTSEIGVGKYVSPNLFLRYIHVLGDEPADRLGVEYRLNDTFSIGSSVSTTGDAGLDLILRKDF